MEVEVVVLGERSSEEVLRWTVRDRSQVTSIHWKELALGMIRRARSGQRRIGEVFLCYRGERPEEYYDHDLLESLITLGREHAWGSSIHIVLDSRPSLLESVNDYQDSIEEWFRTALRAGVADFLQIKMDPSGQEPVDALLLRSACDRARSIGESLGSSKAATAWEVVLAGKGGQLDQHRDLFAPFVRARGLARPDSHLLIAVHGYSEVSQQASVSESLKLFKPERATVVTVGVRPETPLWEYCQSEGMGLVWFRGPFELKYFLLRYSAAGESPAAENPTKTLPVRDQAEDAFTYYDNGLREVFLRIEPAHPSFRRALVFEERLRANIRMARHHEDTETLMAQSADSDEAGHPFRRESGHPFRGEGGHPAGGRGEQGSWWIEVAALRPVNGL